MSVTMPVCWRKGQASYAYFSGAERACFEFQHHDSDEIGTKKAFQPRSEEILTSCAR